MLKSKAHKIYDFRKIIVPEKLLQIEVKRIVITNALNEVSEKFLTIEEVDDKISVGDIVSVNLKSNIDKYNQECAHIAVGKRFFNNEIETRLLEMKKGEIAEVTIDDESVTIEINSIKRRIFPTVSDELIEKLNLQKIKTVHEYERYIVDEFVDKAKQKKLDHIIKFVKKETLKNSDFELIDEEVNSKYLKEKERVTEQAIEAGKTYEEIVKRFAAIGGLKDATVEESEKFFFNDCILKFKAEIIGISLASGDGIVFDEESYEKYVDELTKNYGIPSREDTKRMIPFNVYMNTIYETHFDTVIWKFYLDKFIINERN